MNGLNVFVMVAGERIEASSVDALRARFESVRDENCYGASDIGARFRVKRADGKIVGTLYYNGRFEENR